MTIENQNTTTETYRHKFHIMPPKGWLNDPNGMCYYKGKYHAFFQYSPEDVNGGSKSWGHYASEDLLNWEFLGEAVKPDTQWDRDGAYSGCAFVDDGLMELFYTGNIKEEGVFDYVNEGRGSNVIYMSSQDGVHFSSKELLLTNKNYPADYTCSIRDPKVWKVADTYYMVIGARRRDGQGTALFYQSKNKKQWDYTGECTTPETFGYMWECPDYFMLAGLPVLSCSPQGVDAQEYAYQNIYQSGYFVMKNKVPTDFVEWDMGFDFYAPQTFAAEGRRIMVGWAGVPDADYRNTPIVAEGWQHSFTLFRELTVKDGRILQSPVEEYKQLRGECIDINQYEETQVPWQFDMEVNGIQSDLAVTLGDFLQLEYQDGVVTLQFLKDAGDGRDVRKGRLTELRSLRMLVDTSIVEYYLNDGEMVFTTRFFADLKEQLCLQVDGQATAINLWEI